MEELYKLIIGIAFLILGFPIGNFLAKITKEELKKGRFYFKIFMILSLIGAIVFLILGNDPIMFGLLFIAIVTSRSIKK
ncbi:Uncharacterised protein [uncultured archaeon]|nr:Uncharacterised protein [uncultured archaeon]